MGHTVSARSYRRQIPIHIGAGPANFRFHTASVSVSVLWTTLYSIPRSSVTPRLRDPFIDIIHVSEEQLMQSLRSTVLGSSSTLHVWDPLSERLVLRGVHTGNEGILIIDGKEHSVGQR